MLLSTYNPADDHKFECLNNEDDSVNLKVARQKGWWLVLLVGQSLMELYASCNNGYVEVVEFAQTAVTFLL